MQSNQTFCSTFTGMRWLEPIQVSMIFRCNIKLRYLFELQMVGLYHYESRSGRNARLVKRSNQIKNYNCNCLFAIVSRDRGKSEEPWETEGKNGSNRFMKETNYIQNNNETKFCPKNIYPFSLTLTFKEIAWQLPKLRSCLWTIGHLNRTRCYWKRCEVGI